jgi:hypothetical protein
MSIIDGIKRGLNPTSIDAFKATIGRRSGLARQNRFALFMTPPQQTLLNLDLQNAAANLLSGSFSVGSLVNDPRDIALLCNNCQLPGRQIQTLEKQFLDFRQSIKVPTGYFNEDINFEFHLTNDYYIKKIFDRWSGSIIDQETYHLKYDSEYKTDVTIQQLNEQNIPVYGVKLKNAYPVTVNSVDLNNESSDTTQKLSVTMTFEDFETEGALSSVVSSVKNSIGGLTRLI